MLIKKDLLEYLNTQILGKNHKMTVVLAAFIAGEHILLEDHPGNGKTTLAKSLAQLFSCEFQRIQGTSDLLPSDITGSLRWNKELQGLTFIKGPLFADFVMIDELNRIPPKTQSAFLQAMEEHEISFDGVHYPLSEAFFVIATQNPIKELGTHNLPIAQRDRFGISLSLGLPERDIQKMILFGDKIENNNLCHPISDLFLMKENVQKIEFPNNLKEFMLDVFERLNEIEYVSLRAMQSWINVSQAYAYLLDHDVVKMRDLIETFTYVIQHRISSKDIEKVVLHV